MIPEVTADELLARIRERDEQALGELYERFAPRLLGLLVRILPRREAAQETLEQVFLRLWESARCLEREGASVAAWLTIQARAAAVERLRRERKLPTLPCSNALALSKSFPWLPRPHETARIEARRELLTKLLNQLPEPQRGVLDLVFCQGLTQVEIAQQLGEPLARVKTQLRAATTFLKHRLRAVLGTWSANI